MTLHISGPASTDKLSIKANNDAASHPFSAPSPQRPNPHSQAERPRERLLNHGPHILTNAELLALVLRTGKTGLSALELGQALIQRFGSLRRILQAPPKALLATPGLGVAKTCEILAIGELNRRALEESLSAGNALNQPKQVKEYCMARLAHLRIEHCIALYLDNQLRLITTDEVARGTLSQASVYPREIVKAGLRHHAAAVILAHNHPSGAARASEADIMLTRHLKRALALVDIRLLDHLIIAGNAAFSLAEQGEL